MWWCLLLPAVLGKPGWQEEACLPRNLDGQNYVCSAKGKITCRDGWIGDLCQVPVCGPECDPQHGFCTEPGKCRCNLGYSGKSCRECKKLPGCQHGFCEKSFECKCEDGWSGMFCSEAECPASCQEGGRGNCKEPGVCICSEGYQGEGCTQCSTRKGCRHGVCNKPGDCVCKPGWKGPLCDQAECGECSHGSCTAPGVCRCSVGWAGDRCDQCVSYPGCVNGECVAPYECRCVPGWQGRLCDQPEVSSFGGGLRPGRCLPVGSFLCMAGGEDRCQYDGVGRLVGEPRCTCREGREGRYCERRAGIEPRAAATNITAVEEAGPVIKVVKVERLEAAEELEELEADIVAGDDMVIEDTATGDKLVIEDIEAGDEMVGFGWKDLSKTSSKTLYPEVVTKNLRKAPGIHGDLSSPAGSGVGLGEGIVA